MGFTSQVILVVDDEKDLVESIQANLEVEGYAVVAAHDGEQALRLVEERDDLHLVLLDVRMPRVNGIEALARIRAKRPRLPVILMSAYAVGDTEDRALELGAYTIIQKPFDMGVALRLIARALGAPAVLIIDPNEQLPEVVESIARHSGQRVVAVASSDEALSALRSGAFDVAVLANSRVKALITTLRSLRREEPSLAIVVATRNPPLQLLSEAPRLGISAWLNEPITLHNFLRTIAEVRSRA